MKIIFDFNQKCFFVNAYCLRTNLHYGWYVTVTIIAAVAAAATVCVLVCMFTCAVTWISGLG